MQDNSSSTQSAPDESPAVESGKDLSAAKKLRESVLKDEKIGAGKALQEREKKTKETIIEKKTQKELNEMKEIRNFWIIW